MNAENNSRTLISIIEDLTGQDHPFANLIPEKALRLLTQPKGRGLGYSQFNELLLYLGYDRVTHPFFQFLVDGRVDYRTGASIKSVKQFRNGTDRFRVVAILFFGNVKFAFKTLSRDASFLREHLARYSRRAESSFQARHEQIIEHNTIPGSDTPYLGYLVGDQLNARLKADPDNELLQNELKKRDSLVELAKRNHHSYLVSDHLDVYIATSMRERHEFISVHRTTRAIFDHPALKELKLRWFDPTQAYCEDRIDKGIAEALMLRRAKCTVYFAQESDTLGKDSELASTLAQGKPVIAFVPKPDVNAASRLLTEAAEPNETFATTFFRLLKAYDADAAWNDTQTQSWLTNPDSIRKNEATRYLQNAMINKYNKRDALLRTIHPLGIQMNLRTGVANGVLIANSIPQCAKLIRCLMLRQLQFKLERMGSNTLLLKERTTDSIFRVVTGDAFLTNAFWNFYLSPSEAAAPLDSSRTPDYKKSISDPYDLNSPPIQP